MMLWCHGWGCKPPLTAFHIPIGCVYSDWAPSYAVDVHMGAPLHCYTCAGGGQILKNWVRRSPNSSPVAVSLLQMWLMSSTCLPVWRPCSWGFCSCSLYGAQGCVWRDLCGHFHRLLSWWPAWWMAWCCFWGANFLEIRLVIEFTNARHWWNLVRNVRCI